MLSSCVCCHTPELCQNPGYVTWLVLNFGSRVHISGIAETVAVKFCTRGDYIKSCQIDDKSHPIRGVVRFTCMRNCGFRQGKPLSHVNNAVDGEALLLTPVTIDDSDTLSWLQLHPYDLLLICCKLDCISYVDNKLTKWSWALPRTYVLITDIWRSV